MDLLNQASEDVKNNLVFQCRLADSHIWALAFEGVL